MEQKLSDTLVKAIDRSNPMMQNLQLASRFNKLIDEGGGGADLEDDHATTIDVSAYTDPVEVIPAEGKDGMKKNTVTLTNIPKDIPLYAWKHNFFEYITCYTYTENPSVGDTIVSGAYGDMEASIVEVENGVSAVGENQITIPSGDTLYDGVYIRDSSKDIVLQAGEGGGDVTVEALNVTENGTYTAPAGKAYSPVTVNVPTGGSTTLYCWTNLYDGKTSYVYHNFSTAPENTDNWKMLTLASIGDESNIGELALDDWDGWYGSGYTYTKDSDTQFTISDDSGNYVYTRAVAKDFTLWG